MSWFIEVDHQRPRIWRFVLASPQVLEDAVFAAFASTWMTNLEDGRAGDGGRDDGHAGDSRTE